MTERFNRESWCREAQRVTGVNWPVDSTITTRKFEVRRKCARSLNLRALSISLTLIIRRLQERVNRHLSLPPLLSCVDASSGVALFRKMIATCRAKCSNNKKKRPIYYRSISKTIFGHIQVLLLKFYTLDRSSGVLRVIFVLAESRIQCIGAQS